MSIEEMTISQYDVEILRDQQAERKRKRDRAMNRWEYTSHIVGWIAAAATIIGVSWIIWQACVGNL